MPTYTEALPPRPPFNPRPGIRWTPSATERGGHIVVYGRACTEYLLAEFAADGGRGFLFAKTTCGTDRTSDRYNVFCTATAGLYDACECKGFASSGHCKHVDAARALIDNRWI